MKSLLLAFLVAATHAAADEPPSWAYPKNPPGFKPKPDDGAPRRIEGSKASYTLTQLRDRFTSPVWHPEEHPQQPEVVARGRKPDVFACGFCHRADGPGGPENANLAGLPAAYIVQRLHKEIRAALAVPAVAQRYRQLDSEIDGSTPEEFLALVRRETPKWAEVVKRSGAKLD